MRVRWAGSASNSTNRPSRWCGAPRVTFSSVGNDAVLRGAAALAVSGVLSPRFGTMFAERPGPALDPLVDTSEDYRHERA